ncbi:MAG: phosphoribosyltransferase family protein [Sphaerochaetaceae bacterium]|jgi:orotate phosphoribosyltransferase|nr:orotate phosphoribosyltransferase [Sphaerochaetaceae bacterium]NLO61023.1 orotate phosphoribosyltransferase [Spirochaetales bacterium]MDD3670492.1 phosphoribosyltransferase family protein [Sphaerochaetaceae bacterium]MDD4259278.1 phosphoribosyltransferase family protein [Sphaerochaetaceae bacterium]MDD4841276.1 phosphoribosyltransferase family protein [Sphaerochaetaceae bacterium]
MPAKTIDDVTSYYGPLLAKGALLLQAIRLSPTEPFEWASGYRMPIYNDNRRFLARPESRSLISEAFEATLEALKFEPDGIAGTSTAGIPHATTLADRLALPLSYVRSSGKDHGLHNLIEGLGEDKSYNGQQILLIEDLISTGGSSAKAVQAIIAADGVVPYCLAIFSYGMPASLATFAAITPNCTPIALLDYETMVKVALEAGYINEEGAALLAEWRTDPFGWGSAHGFPPNSK